jgi:PhoH-like ATPase
MQVVEVSDEFLDELYKNKEIDAFLPNLNQNQYLVLKSLDGSNASALARVIKDKIVLLRPNQKACAITAKNKEQSFALDALLDDSVEVVVLTGKAGTGKTLLALAAALQKFEEGRYDKLIFSRPTSQVGHRDLGILPGEVEQKFHPYLQAFMCNLDFVLGKKFGEKEHNLGELIDQYNARFDPIQLMRGASYANAFILIDECQVLDYHEIKTIGTRPGPGSKIVLLGDLDQRDERIAKEKTGLYKFINAKEAQESDFVASLELIKSERSRVCALFADIFDK